MEFRPLMLHSPSPQLRQTRDGIHRSFHLSTSYSDLVEAFRTHVVSILPSSYLLDQLEDLLADLLYHGRDKPVPLAEAEAARASRNY